MLKPCVYYEDVEVGYHFQSPGGRTFTNAEVVNFAQFTGDYNLIHIDHEFARTSLYKENLVHGACVLALTGGMFRRTDFALATADTLQELVEIEYIRYKVPVKFNDTVYLDCQILNKRDCDEESGYVTIAFNGINQNGQVVLESARVYQIAKQNGRSERRP